MADELKLFTSATGATPYALIRNPAGQVWNGTAFVTYSAGDIDEYDLALDATDAPVYTLDFPDTLPASTYTIQYYDRSGATPAADDPIYKEETFTWSGRAWADYTPGKIGDYAAAGLQVVVPPRQDVVSYSEVLAQCRADPTQIPTAIATIMVNAAVDFAETSMDTSLAPRTLQASLAEGNTMLLRRGPLLAIRSVKDAGGNDLTYKLHNVGKTHRLIITTNAQTYPVTVLYDAGYDPITRVPGAIKLAILQHVATMNEQRESVSEVNLVDVPQSLRDFYRLHSRGVGVA